MRKTRIYLVCASILFGGCSGENTNSTALDQCATDFNVQATDNTNAEEFCQSLEIFLGPLENLNNLPDACRDVCNVSSG
ncbi:MAG: hypothetical protein KDD48_08475 [Bdellovibrionales bacterium]|nr:hypothetical protein [Bdellovibrionales bacterium]